MAPNERQIALFRAMEDIHDLTQAVVVLLVDEVGTLIAASGDENDCPSPIRAVLSANKLAAAGSARALLSSVVLPESPLNVTIFAVASTHVLAIVFDAEADIMRVQQVGAEARDMLVQILEAPL